MIESGRDARELLNEISASRRTEMFSLSGKVATDQQNVSVSNTTATGSLSSTKALAAQQCIENSTVLQNSKNMPVPNPIVSDSLPRPNELSADEGTNTATHAHSMTITDIAQQGNSSARSNMNVPREHNVFEPAAATQHNDGVLAVRGHKSNALADVSTTMCPTIKTVSDSVKKQRILFH